MSFPVRSFTRSSANPILRPDNVAWRSYATYNPAVWSDGKRVFMLFRAQGKDVHRGVRTSRFGFAQSEDGCNFRLDLDPVLIPSETFEIPGGCEDPRLVQIDGTFYLTYTAYDGRVARLSMAISNDLRSWRKLGAVISVDQWDRLMYDDEALTGKMPRGWSKSGAILPHPIDGHYWMYFGDLCIWAARSRDLRQWEVEPSPVLSPRRDMFDSRLVEGGPPPILTRDGIWLVYNSANNALWYRIGQVILSPTDPTKVIERIAAPVLEPVTVDEMVGQVNHVVFASGLIRLKDLWLLYYGMADSAVGMAFGDQC